MRRIVKNGFVEVVERQAESTFHNPSTHEQDRIMRQQWTFTPSMFPDDAEMPRSIEGAAAAFAEKGTTLPSISTFEVHEFKAILEKCEKSIESAYKQRYEPQISPSEKELGLLGFK